MAQRLAKHGSEAGYKAHISAGDMCDRCRNGHRVYARQYRPQGRAKGLHYGTYDVIDHLYSQSRTEPPKRQSQAKPSQLHPHAAETSAEQGWSLSAEPIPGGAEESSRAAPAPSLADRVSDGLRKLVLPDNEYVNQDDTPDYIHAGEPDPEPADNGEGEWQGPEADEYVINKAGMVLIEENLGTYLSVVGITLEMIDPYCGPILADNFENIVGRWTKVIAKYPRAARLFMSKDGGTIMSWMGALQATWPVLLAIYDHHLAKTIQTDKQGRIFKVSNAPSPNGQKPDVDATTPPFAFTVD